MGRSWRRTTARQGFVIRFVGSEPGTAGYLAQLSVNRATDWPSFKAAADRWRLPTENLIYADVDGNIGWVAAGLMPMRQLERDAAGARRRPLRVEGLPAVLGLAAKFNPPEGFIATANNNILPAGYDKPLYYEWAEPFRADRIREVLGPQTDLTLAGFERLQHDERRCRPGTWCRCSSGSDPDGVEHREALATLNGWDFVMRKDGAAPLLFPAWFDSLSRQFFRGRAGAAPRDPGGEGLDQPALLRTSGARRGVWPEPGRGTRSFLVRAFDAAAAQVSHYGHDPAKWSWGDIHLAPFRHPLASDFDLPAASRGGHVTTLYMTAGPDLTQTHGASFREVLDLADWDNSVATNVPGQSGQPGSPFYGNLLPLWEKGEYFPLVYSRKAVEEATAHVLWLRPQ